MSDLNRRLRSAVYLFLALPDQIEKGKHLTAPKKFIKFVKIQENAENFSPGTTNACVTC